jgi:CheY-like chemotaxis protein
MLSFDVNHTTEKIVAIFDDEEDILTICSYILTELGWSVYTFTDCDHILDKLADIRPLVILMDNWIPNDGGIVATRTLKSAARFRDIPVIYFSANSDIASLAELAGADAYLAKPFELDELSGIIERVINP